jgi:hypothetical protein
MSKQELFEFLKEHLSIDVEDTTYWSYGGPQDRDLLGIKIKLILKNPTTGELVIIDEKNCSIG